MFDIGGESQRTLDFPNSAEYEIQFPTTPAECEIEFSTLYYMLALQQFNYYSTLASNSITCSLATRLLFHVWYPI